jgi:hypothetical protein
MDEIHQDMAKAARGQIRLVRVLVIALSVSLILGTIAIAQNVGDIHHNRQRIEDIEAARVERNRAICISYNVLVGETREAQVDGLDAVLRFARNMSPTQRAAIVASYRVAVVAQLPYRDCSMEGIAAFLAHPPPDPNRK